jgi:general secretion pathway protein A
MSDVVRPNVGSFGKSETEPRPDGDHSGHRQHPRPFRAGTDPDRLWLGRAHQQILGQLKAAVLVGEGVLLLTGDVGTGKTILVSTLRHRLRDEAIVATVTYVGQDPLDFLKEIWAAWGVDGTIAAPEAFYTRLSALLHDAAARGKRFLLVVDEAQALSQELVEEVERLAEVAGERPSATRLSILLVGQDELEVVLSRPEHAALAKRIGLRCATVPLTDVEVGEYVAHQLKIAGSPGPVFTKGGLQELTVASQGILRLINTIADLALLDGAPEGRAIVGAEIVRQCAYGDSLSRPAGGARARTGARLRARPARRVALYVPVFILLVGLAGYFYQSARHGESRPAPGPTGDSVSAPTPDPPGGGGTIAPEPARASDAAPRTPLVPSTPDPGRQVPRRETPAAAPPETPARASLRQAAPFIADKAMPRPEGDISGAPAGSGSQQPAAPLTGPPGRSSEVRAGEGAQAEDPTAIIDWLLSEFPARRQ